MNKIYLFIILIITINQTLIAQINDTISINEVVIKDSVIHYQNIIKIDNTQGFTKSTTKLLESHPGISIVKRGVFAEEPIINSFKYEQVKIIKNGGAKASSSCPNRMDPASTRIAPNELKQIEIVTGPYELRYGQIMGGMVRFVTNKAPKYTDFTINGNVGSEFNTNGNGTSNKFNISGGTKKIDFKTFANYRKFANYTSGDGTEIVSSFETYGFGVTTGLNINKNQRIVADWSYSRANDVLHAGLPMDAEYDKSNMASIDYSIKNINSLIEYYKLNLYASDEKHLMTNKNRPNAAVVLANTPVESQNYGGKMELKLVFPDKTDAFVGVDINHIQKDGTKDVTIFKNICATPPVTFPTPVEKEFSVWQDSYIQDFGLFTQFKTYITDNFIFKGGIRADLIKSDILNPEKDFSGLYNNNLTPDNELNINYFGELKYNFPKQFTIKLAYGKGTRNASLAEKYINHFTIGLDSYEYVGNPHLKSEKNTQTDITLAKNGKTLSTFINLFYSKTDNYIIAKIDTTIDKKFTTCKEPKNAKRFVNINEVYQYGVNFGIKINLLKNYYINANSSYVYAHNSDWDEPLAETPPFNAFLTLGYKNSKLITEISTEYQAEQNRVAGSVGEQSSSSFYLLNFKATYKIIKSIELGFGINNILNTNYYHHLSRPYKNMNVSSQFYEMGRNFSFSAQYLF